MDRASRGEHLSGRHPISSVSLDAGHNGGSVTAIGQELENAKQRISHMEKSMRWWSECVDCWRQKWSQERADRNQARDELRQLKQKYDKMEEEVSQLRCAKELRDMELALLKQQITKCSGVGAGVDVSVAGDASVDSMLTSCSDIGAPTTTSTGAHSDNNTPTLFVDKLLQATNLSGSDEQDNTESSVSAPAPLSNGNINTLNRMVASQGKELATHRREKEDALEQLLTLTVENEELKREIQYLRTDSSVNQQISPNGAAAHMTEIIDTEVEKLMNMLNVAPAATTTAMSSKSSDITLEKKTEVPSSKSDTNIKYQQ